MNQTGIDKRHFLETIFSSVLNLMGILFAVVLFELLARQGWKDYPMALKKFDVLIWLTSSAIIFGGAIGFIGEWSLHRPEISTKSIKIVRWLFRLMLFIVAFILPCYLLWMKPYV